MVEDLKGQGGEEREKTPLCRAYHWTNIENLSKIARSGEFSIFTKGRPHKETVPPGLFPQLKLVYFDPQTRGLMVRPYTFCFMNSPYPSEWQQHPAIFAALVRKMGPNPALVSFDVLSDDKPEVADMGHGIPYFDGNVFGEEFVKGGFNDYVHSIKPLQDYKEGEYTLPELLIPGHIAYNRLTAEPVPDFIKGITPAAK
jgi:hypothetical protein